MPNTDEKPKPCPLCKGPAENFGGFWRCAERVKSHKCNFAYVWTLIEWNSLPRSAESDLLAAKVEGAEMMKKEVMEYMEGSILHKAYMHSFSRGLDIDLESSEVVSKAEKAKPDA